MIVLAYALEALAWLLHYALQVYFYILIGRVIISWVNADPYNPIVRFLRKLTDPVMFWLHRKLPQLSQGGLDFTPIVVILFIQFLDNVLVRAMLDTASKMAQ